MTSTIVPQTTAPAVDEKAANLAREVATGVRALADMIETNPAIADEIGWTLRNLLVPIATSDDQRATLAAFARAGTSAGAKVTKDVSGNNDEHFGVDITLGKVKLRVYGTRSEICERVVTGTREVVEEVPDPEALAAVPTTTVTRTEEIVEWKCSSLLAPAAGGAA